MATPIKPPRRLLRSRLGAVVFKQLALTPSFLLRLAACEDGVEDFGGGLRRVAGDAIHRLADQAGGKIFGREKNGDVIVQRHAAQQGGIALAGEFFAGERR